MAQPVKDLLLSPLWHGFNPWPWNFPMSWVWPRRKETDLLFKCLFYVILNESLPMVSG